MTDIPGLLGALEDLSKFNETLQHLKRCYASDSDSVNAAASEFFAELSQLEQGETLTSIRDKARLAVRELAGPVKLLLQTQQQYLTVINNFQELQAQTQNHENESVESACEELEEAVVLFFSKAIVIYIFLSKSVDESWIYFPVELHQLLEKLANHLACRPKFDPNIAASSSVNLNYLDKVTEAVAENFIRSVSKAVEKNALKPKWQLYKLPGPELQDFESSKNERSGPISPKDNRYDYTQEDEVWLDNDLSRLGEYGSYDFEPGELESFQPVQYIPGKGFVIFEK